MAFWFEYVESRIDTTVLRELVKLDDDALRFVMASWVCDIAGGIELPTKAPKTELACRLILKGYEKKDVIRITGISNRHYFRLKKEINNG